MADYKALYASKLTTCQAVAQQVQSNWFLCTDTGPSHPVGLLDAIAEKLMQTDTTGVRIQMMLDTRPFAWLEQPILKDKLTPCSWFSSGGLRKAVNGGYADVLPGYYQDLPGHIMRSYDFDAMIIAVSPMDKHGYFSLSCVGSLTRAMIAKSKRIIVEVNKFQPRCVTGPQLHISQVDAIVEHDCPMAAAAPPVLDDKSIAIGNLIAEQIPDGACIQLGIGAIPDATGLALKDKHDLGIHTELFVDSMVELIECGAVNNSKKQNHIGKSVTTLVYGSQRVYDYLDDNPALEVLPVTETNDPRIIAENHNFMSVNAALEVDLFGQVCAESVGTKHMSGTGGQVDFVRGACMSPGGKSFIAFTSTAKDDTISKIKPILTPGAIVNTSKNDVDYIVTEYGIAHLRGESLSSRAKQLIAIAHPNFRDELIFDAKKRGIMV